MRLSYIDQQLSQPYTYPRLVISLHMQQAVYIISLLHTEAGYESTFGLPHTFIKTSLKFNQHYWNIGSVINLAIFKSLLTPICKRRARDK